MVRSDNFYVSHNLRYRNPANKVLAVEIFDIKSKIAESKLYRDSPEAIEALEDLLKLAEMKFRILENAVR